MNSTKEVLSSLNDTFEGDGTIGVLSAHGLGKHFGGNVAVDGVSFQVGFGKIVGLIGDNGSGKTTTLNLITRLIRPDVGSVEIAGRRTDGMAPHQVASLGLGRTFQVPQLVGDLTAQQNIEAGMLRSAGSGVLRSMLSPWREARYRKDRSARAEAIADSLGLSRDVSETRVDKLALGLRRLVEVGRTLASASQVICLDEPTAGLNDDEISELLRALKGVCAAGSSILVVEHHVPFVIDLCDEVVLLEHGKVKGVFDSFHSGDLPKVLADYVRHVPSIKRRFGDGASESEQRHAKVGSEVGALSFDPQQSDQKGM